MVSLLAKKIRLALFGEKPSDAGERGTLGCDVRFSYDFYDKYFKKRYSESGEAISSLINYLNIRNRSIVSIGSGTGYEEILFVQIGKNAVDCIEPDPVCRTVCEEQIKNFKTPDIAVYDSTTTSFESGKKYDVIYASGPGDWMRLDFRIIIPESYTEFFRKFGHEKTLIVLIMRGGSHHDLVLKSSWFLKSLIRAFAQKTNYRLLEFWVGGNGGSALVIAGKDSNILKKNKPEALFLPGQLSGVLKYGNGRTFDPRVRAYEHLDPYLIVMKKTFSILTNKLKKLFLA